MQLQTLHRDFKGDPMEVGAVIGLICEKFDNRTDFDMFREKIKGYVERKLNNAKDVMYVVMDMEDPTKTF